MAQILLQNATGENIGRSLRRPIHLDAIRAVIGNSAYAELSKIYPTGDCWLWGLRDGPWNRKVWDAIESGTEIAVIAPPGDIQLYAKATFKRHDVALANKIWNENKANKQKPFEFTYFSTRPLSVNLSRQGLNALAGYKFDRTPQKAFFLTDEASDRIRQALLESALAASLHVAESVESVSGFAVSDALFGDPTPPAIVPYAKGDRSDTKEPPRATDMFAWMMNRERRTQAHEALRDAIADRAVGHNVGQSALIDLTVDGDVFIEVKSIESDAVRQVRAALAQLYHYRFVYRKAQPNAKLLAVFQKQPMNGPEDLGEFLDTCGIAHAWQRTDGHFEGSESARLLAPWLFT